MSMRSINHDANGTIVDNCHVKAFTPANPTMTRTHLKEVIITKAQAVFWMDAHGKWCNRHGRFEHKRIIHHFNRSIRRDQDGYYVTQIRGDVCEKVYFTYADTPLFAVRLKPRAPYRLGLNTGESVELVPANLFVRKDQLYQRQGDERIRFTERALFDIAPFLDDTPDGLIIRIGHDTWLIPDG